MFEKIKLSLALICFPFEKPQKKIDVDRSFVRNRSLSFHFVTRTRTRNRIQFVQENRIRQKCKFDLDERTMMMIDRVTFIFMSLFVWFDVRRLFLIWSKFCSEISWFIVSLRNSQGKIFNQGQKIANRSIDDDQRYHEQRELFEAQLGSIVLLAVRFDTVGAAYRWTELLVLWNNCVDYFQSIQTMGISNETRCYQVIRWFSNR